MESTIQKLLNLHQSVQKLETALQEVWSNIDDIYEDAEFRNLLEQVKQSRSKKKEPDMSMGNISVLLKEFENLREEIPEDGGVGVDFEDAILDLIDWIKEKNEHLLNF